MLRLLSKRILGAAPREVRSPSPALLVLSRFCHERVVDHHSNPRNAGKSVDSLHNNLSSHSASAFLSVAQRVEENQTEQVLSGEIVFKGFDFNDKDLSSEESLWDLYERWIKYNRFSRSVDEKYERFNLFKVKAMFVNHTNKRGLPFKLRLNMFTDKADVESYINFLGVSKGFDFNNRDLSSEESLWDLYERWIRYYGFPQTLDEENKRVKLIKAKIMKHVAPFKLKLNTFADWADDESYIDFLGIFKGFVFNDKDMSSRANLLKLYKRWKEYYGLSRSCDKEYERFNLFMVKALLVHNTNKKDLPFKLGLNMFADKGEDESYASFLSRVNDGTYFYEEDFLLEESLCDLYEGWIRYYGFPRNSDEEFKHSYLPEVKAKFSHITNKKDFPFKLRLNKFVDKVDDESYVDFFGVFKGFDFNEKDLSSPESLWDLYERWISYYGYSRSLAEKYDRFNLFRIKAMLVHNTNKKDLPFKFGLNMFADKADDETYNDFLGVPDQNFDFNVRKEWSSKKRLWHLYEKWVSHYGFSRYIP